MELQNLADTLGKEIVGKLPPGTDFVLLVANKEEGKCATSLKRDKLRWYLQKVADSIQPAPYGMQIIEVTLHNEDN